MPGRPSNLVETVTLTISTTPQIKRCLEVLSENGIFGKSAAETANLFLAEKIRTLINEGTFLSREDLATKEVD